MKRIVLLLIILIGSVSLMKAYDGPLQNLSPEEFRQKQKTFITEKAGLTAVEAEKFFPLYFELQDKKKELNDKAWQQLHKGKDDNLTNDEYEKIMLEVYDLRMASDQLDKTYYIKFKTVLSPKKIYMVQRAEMRFHRELVKGINRGGGEGGQRGKK
ncbi:hypothetical protein [Bacteroides sp. 519]|uniref:hypothetical protein n=1 Tax=Bacteroides sp. 519 TaxID=2302937 RepID=UPI0013D7CD5C|nr:hypothetical protein [Bacteroides sp. 519]NDV57917.1 hypothetical protein [Bacteroides sp. 519]